jgi:hypothetical protein
VGLLGAKRAFFEGVEPQHVEGMQGIQHRLVVAAQVLGDPRGSFASTAGE